MNKRPPRRLPDVGRLIAGAAAAVLVIAGVWAALVEDPLGGEPVAVVQIQRSKAAAKLAEPASATATPAPAPTGSATASNQGSPRGPGTGPLIIKVPSAGGAGGLSPASKLGVVDQAMQEASKHGAIPKIGADGRRAADLYSSTSVAEAEDRRPKVAILIGGLGIGNAATASVLEKLPGQISLGFTPYGDDLEAWVAKARAKGHEIMLQVPMEPFDFPNNDPGPQTLLTSLPAPANLDRLKWAMSRFSGYFGVTNYMGAKFTASEVALLPILTETARRGLFFLDNGSSPRSLVAKLAPEAGASVARAELTVDSSPDAVSIDAALTRLEDRARRDGAVIGVASALPVSIARIGAWTAGLNAKGIALVPVSTVVKRSNPS